MSVTIMLDPPRHIGCRRSSSWWEPIYKPGLSGRLELCDWTFRNSTGPQQSYLPAELLKPHLTEGEVYKLENLTFAECDIQGIFDHKPSLLFINCRFHGCDFAFSEWNRATFRDCEFRDCSLSIASFKECEFRGCAWYRIGFSGNKTDIFRTLVTNPDDLVRAGYSAAAPDKKSERRHVAYQRYRLEGTKAHLARNLLYSHQLVGDDETYYRTAKLHDIQQTKARISAALYTIRHSENWIGSLSGLSALFWVMELLLLLLVGFINAWGSRLLQPLLLLVASLGVYGIIYAHLPGSFAITDPWQKAFDICSLAGYTNQSTLTQPVHLRVVEGSQLIVSIFLYTIFFSTAVARFSRTR